MLDFYLINDTQEKSISHENLVYLGGLDDKTFRNLQTKGILTNKYDFYSDFRLSFDTIKQLQNTVSQNQLRTDTDVIKFRKIIDCAIENNCGVIAFGD